MLRDEDIRIHQMRCEGGQNAIMMEHVPSGIKRGAGPPLAGLKVGQLNVQWRREIEEELISRGWHQYVVPGPTRMQGKTRKPAKKKRL